jgi:hypothetical protein
VRPRPRLVVVLVPLALACTSAEPPASAPPVAACAAAAEGCEAAEALRHEDLLREVQGFATG